MKYMCMLSATANLANKQIVMSDDLKGAIITALVTGIISIVGFIVTNTSMKKSFKNELKQQRDNIALEKMTTMPYEVLVLMDEMIESGKIKNDVQKKKNMEQNLKHGFKCEKCLWKPLFKPSLSEFRRINLQNCLIA